MHAVCRLAGWAAIRAGVAPGAKLAFVDGGEVGKKDLSTPDYLPSIFETMRLVSGQSRAGRAMAMALCSGARPRLAPSPSAPLPSPRGPRPMAASPIANTPRPRRCAAHPGKSVQAGARVTSNSWGKDEVTYEQDCANVDAYLRATPDLLAVFSAGNEGGKLGLLGTTGSTTSPGVCKNVLSVGGTEVRGRGRRRRALLRRGTAASGGRARLLARWLGVVRVRRAGFKTAWST